MRAHDPDVLCIQEARVKAACSNPKAKVDSADPRDRGRPDAKELDEGLRAALRAPPLDAYRAYWSLANGRAAGTATLVHRRVGAPLVENTLAAEAATAAAAASGAALGGARPPRARHQAEGRVQVISFPSFDILHTCVHRRRTRADASRFERSRAWGVPASTAHTFPSSF